jgi:hypothetical protein
MKKKLKKENYNKEGTVSVIVAIFVMFSAVIDPIVSVIISFSAIMGYSIYFFSKKK